MILEYFKPWRRKFGVLALMMACVLMAAWLRSFSSTAWVAFPTGKKNGELIGWMDRHLIWTRYAEVPPTNMKLFPSWSMGKFTTIDTLFGDATITNKREWCGFAWIESGGDHITAFVMPYWSIALPLALSSTYLLLSKPRLKKVKTIEPPAKGIFSS